MDERGGGRILVHPVAVAVGWVVYAVVSYFIAMYATGALVVVINHLGVSWSIQLTSGALIARCVVYALVILFLWAGLHLLRVTHRQLPKLIGLARSLEWKDVGLSVVGFLAYGVLTVIMLTIASKVPGFDSSQSQNVGVTHVYGMDRILAFLVLVVVSPVAEEVIFRGMLYGYLRKLGIWRWAVVLVTSLLFGIAHGQWNVGLDVFCLSVILCILRELTGSIWAGLVVHILKNLLAFSLLYLVS